MKTDIETLKDMLKQAQNRLNEAKAIHAPDNDMARNVAYYEAQTAVLRKAIETMERAEKLPKTADGVTAWPGMTVYFLPEHRQMIWKPTVHFKYAVFWNGRQDVAVSLSECYSTEAAALEAANRKDSK